MLDDVTKLRAARLADHTVIKFLMFALNQHLTSADVASFLGDIKAKYLDENSPHSESEFTREFIENLEGYIDFAALVAKVHRIEEHSGSTT